MEPKCRVWLIITESACAVVWEDFKTKRNGTDDVFSFFNLKFYLRGMESSSILVNPWERSVCASKKFIRSTFHLSLCPVVRVAPNVICFRTHQVLPRILLHYAWNYEAWQTCVASFVSVTGTSIGVELFSLCAHFTILHAASHACRCCSSCCGMFDAFIFFYFSSWISYENDSLHNNLHLYVEAWKSGMCI